jgi:hypothetical protein
MPRLLAIDPGNTESAWVVIDVATRRPIAFAKDPNEAARRVCLGWGPFEVYDHAAIEMVASYGMAVGAEVFDTCVWIGRFIEALDGQVRDVGGPDRVFRRHIKLHHCHSPKANDSNITQALVDRFAPGQPNRGKGTKTQPGWFHGFAADIWQAYALAVYAADLIDPENAPA